MIHKYLAKTATCHLCEGTAIPYIKHVIGASMLVRLLAMFVMYQKITFLDLFWNVHNIIINDICVVKKHSNIRTGHIVENKKTAMGENVKR